MTALLLRADVLQEYRESTFYLRPGYLLRTPAEAREFVEARGFIYFWPIKDILLPSLWQAVAGDRPVAAEHDDPGHITWSWKDRSLSERWWYYAKVLRGKATLISLDVVPCFYALSENYGDPDRDYLDQYRDGLLSHEAKRIYETLLEEGPLDTVNLRRKIHMTSKASNSPFERALTFLQRDFKILPVGVAQTGAWRYSFIYECVHRWYPWLPERARPISRARAREHLLKLYFRSLGAARLADVRKLFRWPRRETDAALQALLETGILVGGCRLEHEPGEWLVLKELVT